MNSNKIRGLKFSSLLLGLIVFLILVQCSLGLDYKRPSPLTISKTNTATMAHLNFSTQLDRQYEILSSTNLITWLSAERFQGNGAAQFRSFSATNIPGRFFRLNEILPLQSSGITNYVSSGLAFNPTAWTNQGVNPWMKLWFGDEIVLLTTTNSVLDPFVMASFVDKMDLGWRFYRSIIGKNPGLYKNILGKPTIAAIPNVQPNLTCGYGCGYIGSSGIEVVGFYGTDYPAHASDQNQFYHYYFYEMGRNFYIYGHRHSLFTTGFAVFMRYMCMDDQKLNDVDASTRQTIEQREGDFANSTINWFEAFYGPGGNRLPAPGDGFLALSDPPVLYASIMMFLVKNYGGEFLNRFYREIESCAEFEGATTNGALNQVRNWAAAFSVAARTNIAPLAMQRWKFPLTTNDATEFMNFPIDGTESAGALVERLLTKGQPNLLQNASFENGLTNWSVGSWRGNSAAVQVTTTHHVSGNRALLLQATNLSDVVTCVQTVIVQTNSQYLLSARIRTEAVTLKESGNIAAGLHVGGTSTISSTLLGNNEWKYVCLSFFTGSETTISVGPLLGYWSSATTGKAWVDSLNLVKIASTP